MFQGSRVQGLNCQEGLDDLRHGSKREWGEARQKGSQLLNTLLVPERSSPSPRPSPWGEGRGEGEAGMRLPRRIKMRCSSARTVAAQRAEVAMSSRGEFWRWLGSTRPVLPPMTGFSIYLTRPKCAGQSRAGHDFADQATVSNSSAGAL